MRCNHFFQLPCRQWALALLMLAAVLSHIGSVRADCKAFNGSLPQSLDYNMSVVVPEGLSAGATIPGTYRPFTITGACTPDAWVGNGAPPPAVGSTIVACVASGTASPVPGIPGVYSTGIAGVGMALLDASGNRVQNAQNQQCASHFGQLQGGGTAPYTLLYNLTGAMELVKTSPAGTPVDSGMLTSANAAWLFGVYETLWVLNYSSGALAPSMISPAGNLQISSVTCTVTSPSTVQLPKVGLSALSRVGSVAGGTPFNIGLLCNKNLKVGIRMEAAPGVTAVDSQSGILGSQGTAQGVGIQLLKSDFSSMPLDQRVDLGNISANGQVSFGYFARYHRTGTTISPGTVQSQMVFTFDYQ
ncbi:fimbrial protein [Pseudomonas sp. MT3]|uniref:fimbrial protein n=1 Tax=Pseudomonas sp. ATCC 13867 TaxID=1294143 RepID=UPI0002C4E05B|nr:fimbrial protein [Pseudomonas sp. ATCC 13867]AGI22551.1 Fimbrial protein [Pseudomonas sp. ATCC 13867]RFQ29914.1 type 1 fimbrial protein [Pseudomonas sp. ATCC 13867]